jgi:hypothetical protein
LREWNGGLGICCCQQWICTAHSSLENAICT